MLKIIAQPHHSYRLGDFLRENLQALHWTHFRAAVAFAKVSGTEYIANDLKAFSNAKSVNFSVGIDHGGTSAEALLQLLSAIKPNGNLWIYKNPSNTFHPKVYLFKNSSQADLIIGSGNLTKGGLYENSELGVRIKLDLNIELDAEFLKNLEQTLDLWSSHHAGTCLAVDHSLISTLKGSGDLPTEAEASAAIKAAKAASKPASVKLPSPFKSLGVQAAPSPPIPSSQLQILQPTAVYAASASSPAISPTVSSSTPMQALSGLTFGMTLQNTDVGVGQTTTGTSKRSPEIFIPLAALDANPSFWGWITPTAPDPSKYQPDTAWRALNSAWQVSQTSTGRTRPVDKLDWHHVQVALKGHAGVLDVRFWFNPKKLDIRMRENHLRSAGNVGDILLVRQAPNSSARHYDMEVISTTDPNYAVYLSKLTRKVTNSKKLFGYF